MKPGAAAVLSLLAERPQGRTFAALRSEIIARLWEGPLPDPDPVRELWKQYYAGSILCPALAELLGAGRIEQAREKKRKVYRLTEER